MRYFWTSSGSMSCVFWKSIFILCNLFLPYAMPVFLFLFGCFAKYSPKRIVWSGVIPYVLFQSIYIAFSNFILGMETELQFSTPYWLLWYLLVCIYFQLLIPLYTTDSLIKELFTLGLVFILAVLIGYDDTFSYYASFSRFFVFQPWFVLGIYYQKYRIKQKYNFSRPIKKLVQCLSIVAVTTTTYGIYFFNISGRMLYGSFPYATLEYSAKTRIFIMITAFSWIVFLIEVVKPLVGKRIYILTTIGQNTFSVFLLHGFIIKLIPLYFSEAVDSFFRVVITACAIVLALGNPLIGKWFTFLFSGHLRMK